MRLRTVLLTALITLLLPAAAYANYPHVVQAGETLTSVAAADGLSVESIAAANGISAQSELIAGQTLWIPPRTADNAILGTAATTAATTATTTGVSSVSETDDFDADNEQSSTGSESTQSAQTSSTGSSSSTATQTATTVTTSTGTTTQSASVTSRPVPTAETVSGGEIATIADANGVPASLAEAIAWQESGWNNDEVSNVGAVGVMQIVPVTWSWIDRYLTPANPLGTASAAENIRGGVLLLHQLLQLTGGNERLAVAGYFQGLASVQAHGMYADTVRYVNNVMALAQRL